MTAAAVTPSQAGLHSRQAGLHCDAGSATRELRAVLPEGGAHLADVLVQQANRNDRH